MSRALTEREASVLTGLLSAEFPDAERYRSEAATAVVVGGCQCRCPSVDFYRQPGAGMRVLVNASVTDTNDGMFLYAVDRHLGGIEWVGVSQTDPDELPHPSAITVRTAPERPTP